MANVFRDKVEQRLNDLGISAFQAADRMKKSRTFVHDIIKGKKDSVHGANLDALADALEVSPAWLVEDDTDGSNSTPDVDLPLTPNATLADVDIGSVARMPKNVPVYGTAAGSLAGAQQGAWQMTSDPVDYVRRPPGLSTAKDAYALYVENESMEPRFPPGELVYVHPGRPVRSGDAVVIQVQTAEHAPIETYIKIMVRKSNGDVICRQYNPEAEILFTGNTVISVHRVMMVAEILGV